MNSDHPYYPFTTEQKLGYLVEECGEVLAAVGKTQRWGLDSHNPEIPPEEQETNREWVLRELQDLKEAIRIVEADLGSPSEEARGTLTAEQLAALLRADPAAYWELLKEIPRIYGPWHHSFDTASNVEESFSRRQRSGRMMAKLFRWRGGGWETRIRPYANPELGLVDFTHEVASPEEGMSLIDEELARQGVLLVSQETK